MTEAHTPGKWGREGNFHDLCRVEFSGGGHYVTISAPGRTIPVAFVVGNPDIYWRDDTETEANARLIAAAPDLLEACQTALAYCEHLKTSSFAVEPTHAAELRAAIAKATTPNAGERG